MKRLFTLSTVSGLLVLCVLGAVLLRSTKVQSSDPASVEVSFKRDLLPVLVQRCGYCHMKEDRHGYLIIDPQLAFRSLVNVPAFSFPQMKRVEPGKPEMSFLIHKMTGEHGRMGAPGRAMPSWPLSKEFVDSIRQWIAQGAKDN